MYGWGNGVDDACGTNGEAAMYGAANMPEPCLLVDFVHTHHTETHVADELFGGAGAELDLVHLCPGYGSATVKY